LPKMLNTFLSFLMLLMIVMPLDVDADTVLTFDTQVSGSISASDDEKIYKVTVPKAGTVSFNVLAYFSAVEIEYRDSNNQTFGKGGSIYNGRPENPTSWSDSIHVEHGVYFIVVKGVKDTGFGDYSLNVSFEEVYSNETEPNQSIKEAMPLQINGDRIKGFINWIDTKDYYKLELKEPGRLKLDVKSDMFNGTVSLYNVSGEDLYWDSLGSIREYTIEWERYTNLEAGTYYVSVMGGGIHQGLYDLGASFTPANTHETEPNNDRLSAETIQFGKDYKGFLSFTDLYDYYQVNMKYDGFMTIEFSSEFGYYQLVREEDGIAYASHMSRTSFGSPEFHSQKVELPKGTYTFRLMGYENYGGVYTFMLRPQARFLDVNYIYSPAVTYLADRGVTNGITETTFGTVQHIKRVDAAIWLAKILQFDTSNQAAPSFLDVPKRGWGAINALTNAGIVNGKSTSYFGANDNVTRGEMALMLQKAYGLEGDRVDMSFSDVTSRYDFAVRSLIQHNITNGKTATTFGTNLSITRGEMALFLYRAETNN
jgi:hypothetical protein